MWRCAGGRASPDYCLGWNAAPVTHFVEMTSIPCAASTRKTHWKKRGNTRRPFCFAPIALSTSRKPASELMNSAAPWVPGVVNPASFTMRRLGVASGMTLTSSMRRTHRRTTSTTATSALITASATTTSASRDTASHRRQSRFRRTWAPRWAAIRGSRRFPIPAIKTLW